MKKALSFLFVFSFIITLFLFQGCGKKQGNVIKIGAILPLTGNVSWLGENAKAGIDLAVQEVKKKNNLKIEVIYGDSKLDPKTAVSLANKMISSDNVDFFIASGTTIVNAIMPITEKNKIIMFAQTIQPNITLKGKYIYRLYGGGDAEWKYLADYINHAKIDKIGVFMINAQYGIDCYNSLTKYLDNNVEILFTIQYPIGENTYRNYITKNLNKIKETQGIVLIGYGNEFVTIIKQLNEYNFNNVIFGNIDFTFSFLRNDKLAENAIFVAPTFSTGEKTKITFALDSNFEKKYPEKELSWDVANSFDTIQLIGNLLQEDINLKNSPKAFYNKFSKLNNFLGASGNLTIDANSRELNIPLTLATIKNGQVIKYNTKF